MISVVILTKNEERDLPGCLSSVRWSDDVVIFDSMSTDGTEAIARGEGVRFVQRSFDGYASQRNAALHDVQYKHPWVLLVDADERIPSRLAREMVEFVKKASDTTSAARLRRKDYFWGTWLKHAQISAYYIRLVRPERVHYEREVNEVIKVIGQIHDLVAPYDHYPFSKGIQHWIDKHNRYSCMEAKLVADSMIHAPEFSWKTALFSKDFNTRRFHQKGLFYKMPCRPLLKFCYMMGVRRAFLDGRAGVAYALLQCVYEYLIVLKTRELTEAFVERTSFPDSFPPGGATAVLNPALKPAHATGY